MKHRINILEETEKHYHSAASTNKGLQLGIVGAVLAVIGGTYIALSSVYQDINKAEADARRWNQIKDQFQAAQERADFLAWVEDNDNTLRGWSPSRHDWGELLTLFQQHIPQPVEKLQFTSMQFQEKMKGLREAVPGNEKNPKVLTRSMNLYLRGVAHDVGGNAQIRQYFDALQQARRLKGSPIASVELQPIRSWTESVDSQGADRHEFTIVVGFKDREVVP